MNADKEICVLCKKELRTDNWVNIGVKGAEGINNASIERGDNIVVTAGAAVHKLCRMNYVNKKDIKRHNRGVVDCQTSSVKRSARILIGPFNSKTDCFFCGKQIVIRKGSSDYDDYSCVRTENFVQKIMTHCKARNDEWSFSVEGRIEYFCSDLHAADCIYHHSCDVNFRTGRDVPVNYRDGSDHKRSKVGRPKDTDQEEAFLKTCRYFEDNDEEQLTLTDLINKMNEHLKDTLSVPYGKQYLKSKLLGYYGDSLFVAEGEGLSDIVTFRHNTSRILREYFNMPNKDDEEAHKK